MRILLVEDEVRYAKGIQRGLQTVPSFVVDLSHDGEDGEFLALHNDYDLIILDLMLPKRDGLEVLQAIRAAGKTTPVLILTARSTKEDIVRGLDYGSDDYLAKPFDLGELIARCRALIRRSKGSPAPLLEVGDLRIDTRRHVLLANGTELTLPALEYRLIEYLAFRKGEVCSKTELLEHLYDYNWEKFSNVLEVYVSSIRRKLQGLGLPNMIRNLRGQGYVLSDSTQCEEIAE
ncbi:response regulator transcription factor [bacterium]|nr:response regulator transcription factor [bacterium]